MVDTDVGLRLAEARGVAEWSAGELHTLLTVYGSQLPAEVARSLTKMQASLASVAGAGRLADEPHQDTPPCPACSMTVPHIAWTGADGPDGPDNWHCTSCGHEWTTPDPLPGRCGDHHASGMTNCTREAGHDGAHHNGSGLTWGGDS